MFLPGESQGRGSLVDCRLPRTEGKGGRAGGGHQPERPALNPYSRCGDRSELWAGQAPPPRGLRTARGQRILPACSGISVQSFQSCAVSAPRNRLWVLNPHVNTEEC